MSITTTSTFGADILRRAFEHRDAGLLASLYADDATVEIVDAQNQPSSPLRLQGAEAIRAHLQDQLGREMTHEVDIVAVGEESAAYSVRCAYPDGARVVCAATSQLREGKIVREVCVQAWDGAD